MAISDKLTSIYNSKVAIKNAIIAKGVATPDNTPLADYSSKITAIPVGFTQTQLDEAVSAATTPLQTQLDSISSKLTTLIGESI